MRIAYLAQSYPPMISGAALFARQIAEAMVERGHQVLVIAASDQDHPYCVQSNNLSVVRLQSLHNPMRVGQRFLLYPRREVMKALCDFRPNVIHTHDPLQISWIGIEYAKRADIPILLTIHQLPAFIASYFPKSLQALTEIAFEVYARWLSRKFTSIVTPTQTIASLVTEMSEIPATAISYGMDLESFHPPLSHGEEAATRQKWGLPPKVPILLHVGRLDADKRVDRVIQATAQALKESDAHLLVVGDGTQKPALIKLCESLGISHCVHFPGYVSREDDLPKIYRVASLFITASEIETQGIVLLEAAASGLPIVAVRATCIHEIVHDGVNGYLADSADSNGLSNAISVLVKNPQKAKSMGKASFLLAAKHNLDHTHDTYEALYSQLRLQSTVKTGFQHKLLKRVRLWSNSN